MRPNTILRNPVRRFTRRVLHRVSLGKEHDTPEGVSLLWIVQRLILTLVIALTLLFIVWYIAFQQ